MESQYLSASIWSVVTAASLLMVLLALGIYLWYMNRVKSVVEDASSVADLSARKDQLESEIEQSHIWLENNREELLRWDAERKEQENDRKELIKLETELAQKEQNIDELKREASDIQNVVSALSSDRDRLESTRADFENKWEVAKEKANAAEQIRVQAAIKAQEVQNDLREKRSELRGLNDKIIDQSLKIESLTKEINDKETNLYEIQTSIEDAKLRKERALIKAFEEEKRLLVLQKQNEKNRQLIDETKEELSELKARHFSQTDKIFENEQKVTRLEARLANLKDKIEQHQSVNTKKHDVYCHLYELPDIFTDVRLISPHGDEYTEENALVGLKSYLDECKLIFHTRVLKSFHTSLKIADISTLAVMAGISGTGKSELPRRYAEALGIHYLPIAVQPRWDSPQDMFGFYNYIEQRYKATELAQSLVMMDKFNHPDKAKFADRMLLVLLDEMNLARVEYYFSEFLSKLEIRKSIDPNVLEDRRKAEISLDVGSKIEGQDVPRLYVHENVLFVGTMNEDESTQTLSDKVIDRANVLRFGRPGKMTSDLPNITEKSENFLPLSVWNSWKKNHEDLNSHARGEIEGWIEELNNGLDDIGRPFGYRINQAIFKYVANYPGVNDQNNHCLAFADQMEQRILPKMRGLDIEQNRSCFEAVRTVIEKLNDQELIDAFDKAESKSNILFSWYGVTR